MKIDKLLARLSESADPLVRAYISDITRGSIMSEEEIQFLARKRSRRVRDQLVKGMLPYVVSIAYSYRNRGVPLIDLISAGNIGVIAAIDHYDPSERVYFKKYAFFWIRQSILQDIEDERFLHIPINIRSHAQKVHDFSSRYYQEHGMLPDRKAIALELELQPFEIAGALFSDRDLFPLESLPEWESYGDLMVERTGDEDETLLRMERELDRNSFWQAVYHVVLPITITDMHLDMVAEYYGMSDQPQSIINLSSLADEHGYTRERARQILDKVHKIVRTRPTVWKYLSHYADLPVSEHSVMQLFQENSEALEKEDQPVPAIRERKRRSHKEVQLYLNSRAAKAAKTPKRELGITTIDPNDDPVVAKHQKFYDDVTRAMTKLYKSGFISLKECWELSTDDGYRLFNELIQWKVATRMSPSWLVAHNRTLENTLTERLKAARIESRIKDIPRDTVPQQKQGGEQDSPRQRQYTPPATHKAIPAAQRDNRTASSSPQPHVSTSCRKAMMKLQQDGSLSLDTCRKIFYDGDAVFDKLLALRVAYQPSSGMLYPRSDALMLMLKKVDPNHSKNRRDTGHHQE